MCSLCENPDHTWNKKLTDEDRPLEETGRAKERSSQLWKTYEENLSRHQKLRDQGENAAELDKVRRALNHLSIVSLGSCQDCGDEIPRARLLSVPHAKFCVSCQQEQESQLSRKGFRQAV